MDNGMIICQNPAAFHYYRGRVALYALLRSSGINSGDHVAVQAFTCLAVPEAILAVGAIPIYVDIEPTGFNMDVDDLEHKLTPQTRAVIVQHTYGIPADMDRIATITEKFKMPIIEDCCHTIVSKYKGKSVGSFGVGSFYSYEWGKPVVAGIGGSAVVIEDSLCEKVKGAYASYKYPALINQAKIELQYKAFSILYQPSLYWPVRSLFRWLGSLGLAESNYNPVGQGRIAADFSLRMSPPVQRRMMCKLHSLERQTRHSRWVSDQYRQCINSVSVSHPTLSVECNVIFVRYPLIVRDKPKLLAAVRRAGVELAEWYATPVHPLSGRQLSIVHYEPGSCPNAETRCAQVVTLPTHAAVSKRDIERAVQFLNQYEM